jgi:hypothetical protein
MVAGGPPGTLCANGGSSRRSGRHVPRKLANRHGQESSDAGAMAEMPGVAVLVRELNHRVKNNFQIIASLMNLRKRLTLSERREDIRFIEEHLQSMAVAYRLGYDTGSLVEVSLIELITEILSGLRQIASLGEERLLIEGPAVDARISLDDGIALSLYLAAWIPPYLDEAIATAGTVTIAITAAMRVLTLSVRGTWTTPINLESLRVRLMRAYAAQLRAEILPRANFEVERLRFVLEQPAAALFGTRY